jgi:succinate dehydrogenase / fumarate reductase, cytochrome b subunit
MNGRAVTSEDPAARPVRRRGVAGWFDPRGRRLGGWAFALNRLTGLALVLYLYLHLVILSLLAAGPGSWDAFVDIALSPPVLALDVVLIFGMLFHGLNGIRVALVGFGFILDRQRALFAALMLFGAIVLVIAALRIFVK